MSTNCIFNCGFCQPGNSHICRKCNAINDHRSKNCPKSACIFNCGFCQPGESHICSNCNAINNHRSINCTFNQNNCITISRNIFIPPSNFQNPVNVGGYIYSIHNGIKYVLLCRRGVSGPMYSKIFGPGGAINNGETADQAIIRETFEEAGVNLANEKCIIKYTFKKIVIYYYLVNYNIHVAGPLHNHYYEILGNGIQGYENNAGPGWSWVPIEKAIEISIQEHSSEHFFTRNLLRILNI